MTAAADRARGLVLGAALGDAMGAPFEGQSHVEPRSLAAFERGTEPLRYTDDTALAIALANHLLAHRDLGEVDQDQLATDFAAAWRAEPWRGYGSAAPHVFGLILDGVGWREAAVSFFRGQGSFGNGGAMRVAPVALISENVTHAAELGRCSAAITHAHPRGQDGAALQAAAAYLAWGTDPDKPIDPHRFLDQLATVVPKAEWQERIESIRTLVPRAGPQQIARTLGNDVTAPSSVPAAIASFLCHHDDATETLRHAIRLGGDTDTIASMACALAGARHGETAWPQPWRERLENVARLRALAGALAGA